MARQCFDYNPPSNPLGYARTEPYNHFGKMGQKEPGALVAASLKWLSYNTQNLESYPKLSMAHSLHLGAHSCMACMVAFGPHATFCFATFDFENDFPNPIL